METTIITFDITTSYDEWVKTYDASVEIQKKSGITSLFRGFKKQDPTKCVSIMQAEPGKLDEFMAANADMISQSGHVIESSIINTYLS
jgi:hypothetical protein